MVDSDEVAVFVQAVDHVLRTERPRHHWTLAQAGARVGLTESVLSRIELGQRPVDMRRFVVMCAALGVALPG